MAINRLIQGSLQSGLPKFDTVWDGRSAVGSMDPISAITLSAAQSSVEFNNIPQTYTHLHLRVFVRSDRGSSLDNLMLRFNYDTASNYYTHRLEGNGSSIAYDGFGGSSITSFLMPTAAELANVFTGGYMDILDYKSTNKNKTYKNFYGFDVNGTTGYVAIRSGGWFKTPEAITSIQLFSQNSANIVANSTLSLYGVR